MANLITGRRWGRAARRVRRAGERSARTSVMGRWARPSRKHRRTRGHDRARYSWPAA